MFERIEKMERQLEPGTQLMASTEKIDSPASNCKTASNSNFEKVYVGLAKKSFPSSELVLFAEQSCLSKDSEVAFNECYQRGGIQPF